MTPDLAGLTKRQAEVFSAIHTWIQREGWAPSYRELANAVGLDSPASVHRHLHMLAEKGKIKLGQYPRQIAIPAREAVKR